MVLLKLNKQVMDIIVGNDKFPLIKFKNDKYVCILPVTKYQFERYIWERAPEINYDDIIIDNPRISPYQVNRRNIKSLFITNISFAEAMDFAKYLGGRLPILNEIYDIYSLLDKISMRNLLELNMEGVDARFLTLLEKISQNLQDVKNAKISEIIKISRIEELCSTTNDSPYMPIYSVNYNNINDPGLVAGMDACSIRIKNAGFRVVIEESI